MVMCNRLSILSIVFQVPRAGMANYWYTTSTVSMVSFAASSYFHFLTAKDASCASRGLPPTIHVSRTLPSGATVASSRTVPVICIWRATSGYAGLTEDFTFRPPWSLTSPEDVSWASALTGTRARLAPVRAIVANKNQMRCRRDIGHLREISSHQLLMHEPYQLVPHPEAGSGQA